MLLSIALILLVGMSMGWICRKVKLPGLLGMLITGIVLGPYVLNMLDIKLLGISADLRKIALIIILTRAGLGLDLTSLKKIGRPAVLMCFVPATFELAGMLLLAPRLMGMSLLEAAVMGAVLAAVSPAVVVPRMVKLMEEGYGVKEGIPQLILAGASVDDVYVIVLFSTFSGMMQGEGASVIRFVNIPVSIILGMIIGLTIGILLAFYFQKVHIRDIGKGTDYSWYFISACSSRRQPDNAGYIFGADCDYVYWRGLAEKAGSCCKKTCRKIRKTVGSGRGLFIRTGRCNC